MGFNDRVYRGNMNIKTFLNAKRLRDYPRLMLFATSAILCINLLLHQGWIGGFGQIIGGDFLMFYTTGLIYRTESTRIYDYAEQLRIQQELVMPTTLNGLNPFMNPPYTAALLSLFPLLPLPWSFLTWSCLTILCGVLAVYIISPLIPEKLRVGGLNKTQYLILILSFFPFIEGILAGQNHGLTLLLVTGILVSAYKEHWFLSGTLAGAMIYKPQLILGLLIIWVIRKNIKALAGFSAVAILWAGSFLLLNGISLFVEYIQASRFFMLLPYADGFPGYIIITLNGFLTSILPASTSHLVQLISQMLFVFAAGLLAWIAYQRRKSSPAQQMPILALALVFPLAFSPYVQLHDLLYVVPIFIVWARFDSSPYVLYTAVFTYAAAFILTLLAATTGIAWMAVITISLFLNMVRWNWLHLTSNTA
jgi:hypothetical protein